MGAAGAFLHGRTLSSVCGWTTEPRPRFNRGWYDWARWPSEGAAINEKARGPSVRADAERSSRTLKEEGRYTHAGPPWLAIPQIPLATANLIE